MAKNVPHFLHHLFTSLELNVHPDAASIEKLNPDALPLLNAYQVLTHVSDALTTAGVKTELIKLRSLKSFEMIPDDEALIVWNRTTQQLLKISTDYRGRIIANDLGDVKNNADTELGLEVLETLSAFEFAIHIPSIKNLKYHSLPETRNPLRLLFHLLSVESKKVGLLYFYGVIIGLLSLTVPLGIQAVTGFIAGGALVQPLVLLMIFIILASLASGAIQMIQITIIEHIQRSVIVGYTLQIHEAITKVKLYGDRTANPELVNRYFDVLNVEKSLPKLLTDFITIKLTMLFGLLLLSVYHPAFIAFSVLFVLSLYLIFRLLGPKGLATSLEESKMKYKMVHWLEELARVKFSIKFKGNSLSFNQQLESLTEGYLNKRSKHFRILIIQFGIMAIFRTLVIGSTLVLGATLVMNAQLTVGQFIAAEIVIISLMAAIEKFIYEIDDIYDLLTALVKVTDITSLEKEASGNIILKVAAQKGFTVQAKNVNVYYPDEIKPSLRNVSFELESGDIVGVHGLRDSGKSTFIRAITGLLRMEGQMLIDDHPIQTLNLDQFRSKVGIITSESALFETDIRTNITLGEPISDEEITEVLKSVELFDWVNNQEHWLDTILGTEMHRFPVSISYRLLLCRLLLKRRCLTIIDYVPSDLEPPIQHAVLKSIMKYKGNSTLLVTASNTEALRMCKNIILLEDKTIKQVIDSDTFFKQYVG